AWQRVEVSRPTRTDVERVARAERRKRFAAHGREQDIEKTAVYGCLSEKKTSEDMRISRKSAALAFAAALSIAGIAVASTEAFVFDTAHSQVGLQTRHGVTKTLIVPVRHTGFINLGKMEKAGFELTFPINRKDYGITWNRTLDAGGAMLGDDVQITVLVEANKEMPPAAAPALPEPTKAPVSR